MIVGEWLRDRWIEDLLNYFIDQRTLVFIAIDVTEAPACQIHYSLAVRAYFNWEARRNAHLLPVSTKISWREWMVDAADPAWTTATITARGALIYNNTKSNASIAVLDFGSDYTSTAGTFTIQLPSAAYNTAIIRIS